MSPDPQVHDEEPVRTGVDRVDAVLAEVADLSGRPVEEHVPVFERAHEQLRRALDQQPVSPPVPQHLRPA